MILLAKPGNRASAIATIFALGIALLTAPANAGLAANAITPAQVQKIVAGIQVLRELKFKSKVPITYITSAAVATRMKADIDNAKDRESIRLDTESGVMLGLYPPHIDLAGASIGMLQGQLGGFYDFRRKDLAIVESPVAKGVVISREQKVDTVDVIAHELTHALQDQNFSIAKSLDNGGRDDDRSIALHAVLEGDATLSGFGFIAGRMDDQVLDAFVNHIPDMEKQFAEKTRDVPFGVREPFIFQYMQGARFVAEAYHRNGWPGVDALYANPPQSTQQIFNPWMYFDRPAPVPQVHVAGYEKVLKDWKKSDESAAGELTLRVVIQATLGQDSSYVALANAWAGDSTVILTRGSSITVLWMIAFTNDESAETFAAAYGDALDKIDGAPVAHRIERNGSSVLVMVGEGAIRFREFLAEVWKQSTVSTPPSPRPPG
jgi:hypothetical protein